MVQSIAALSQREVEEPGARYEDTHNLGHRENPTTDCKSTLLETDDTTAFRACQ